MLTFFVLLFNHLAFREHVKHSKGDFNGMGCMAFLSIPADLVIAYFVMKAMGWL